MRIKRLHKTELGEPPAYFKSNQQSMAGVAYRQAEHVGMTVAMKKKRIAEAVARIMAKREVKP